MKKKVTQNRTISLTRKERNNYRAKLIKLNKPVPAARILNQVINQDLFQVIDLLPAKFVDLLFIDPPYNLSKDFNRQSFKAMSIMQYAEWVDSWLSKLIRLLKPTSSIYLCGDWRSATALHLICSKYFIVRNRITFEREKGRGSTRNWKNNSEDIWFCTFSEKFFFNAAAVKSKRRVIAPYRIGGKPKDWHEENGIKFRATYPANIWTDISIPFWSMSENTPHPTQKPEKLLAKIILASSRAGDVILDPFAGSGTTGVVAKKLKRNFVMIEVDTVFCLYALKRLAMASKNTTIQGYAQGVFWPRNTPKLL